MEKTSRWTHFARLDRPIKPVHGDAALLVLEATLHFVRVEFL